MMVDKAVGAPTKAKNADVRRLHPGDGSTSSRISGSATRTSRTPKKVSNANPQQAEFVWGKAELHQVHQRRRQDAQRDADQAGELRPDEEVSDDGLHLRGAVAGPAQLPRAERPAPASTSRATSATATSCCMPDIVYETGLSGPERDEVRHPGASTRSWRRATSIRSASASRATRGAATRSPT